MALFSRKPPRTPALSPDHRVYAIGDVHGRIDLLEALLARIEADSARRPRSDVLVLLLGDLIDRGPDSAAVVRRAMRPLPWARLQSLRGNHEAAMLDALDGDRRMLAIWLRNGGDAALRSWGFDLALLEDGTADEISAALQRAIPTAERAFIARCPLSLRLGDYFFVHAGVRPGVRLEQQSEQDMLWIRDDFLASTRHHGAIVVHGHSISEAVEAMPNRIGIDTGAYASGRLTAIGLDGEARWFIEARDTDA
jgi:serine/threonine protein phosphatase 1